MRLEPVDHHNPRVLLAALRGAVLGAGPAIGLGMPSPRPVDVAPGTAVVITTSGSTGVPKSVMLSRSALTASALATAARVGEGAWLLALPAGYVAGLQVLVRSLVADREPAVLSGTFSPTAFTAAALTMHSTQGGARVPTFTSLVPAQLQTLLDAATDEPATARALRSFEAILVGGQVLPAVTLERAEEVGAHVVRTYGATETSGGCVYDGRPLDGIRVREVDGELRVAGPVLADGYFDDPAATAAAFVHDVDGVRWYRTGDIGVIERNTVRVRGRIDSVIVSGGINIALDRVERVVRAIPGLEQAVVVGGAHERWGEAPVIVVSRGEALRRSEAVQLDEARTAVAEAIGSHARSVRMVLVDELATLPSGKPDRERIGAEIARLH